MANSFVGAKGGALQSATVMLSKVSGIVGILGMVISTLYYLAIPSTAGDAGTYSSVSYWPTGSTDAEKLATKGLRLTFRAMFFNSSAQLFTAVLTASALSASYDK